MMPTISIGNKYTLAVVTDPHLIGVNLFLAEVTLYSYHELAFL